MKNQMRQWMASLTCTLGVSMTATCFVWFAPLMVRLTSPGSPLPMTTTDSSWVSSFVEIGEVFSTIPAGLLSDRWGRKTVMLCGGPLCIAGWIITLATRSITALYVARFIHGIAVAIAFTVVPIYLAEVAEPRIRGQLSGHFQAMWYAGCLYAYVTGPYLSYENYAYVCAAVPIIATILLCLIPESPHYLLMVKKEDKAFKALTWLRGGNDVLKEFTSIKESVDEEMKQKGCFTDLFATKKDRKAFLIVQLVCLIKYFNGMSAIIMYATQTFEEELPNFIGSDEMTIIFGSILVFTTFTASMVTDRIGRKPLLLTSSAGSAFFTLIVAVIYYLDSNTTIDVSSIKWLTFASIICFSVIANIGLGPLMQTIQAEYFPSHTRGIGGGITEVVASAGAFINIKLYQVISDLFGTYMNYALFFCVSFFGTIIFYYVIPETTGKSLGQIQKAFEKKRENVESGGNLEQS